MLFTLLLSLLTLQPAHAADCSAAFKKAGAEIPRALMKRGYRRFGNLDLARFIQDIEEVSVTSSDLRSIQQKNRNSRSEGRGTGRWTLGHVSVACPYFNGFKEKRSAFAFHEYLGALGFTDHEYRGSLALWLLSRQDAHQLLRSDEKGLIVKWASAKLNGGDGGGAVGVGGGGEIGTVFVRTNYLQNQIDELKKKPRESERKEIIDWLYDRLNSTAVVTFR